MKLSIFLAISLDNFPSISRHAARLSWSVSALPCPQLFCISHFSTMQIRFPVKHNAELCSHAAFDMHTGSDMSCMCHRIYSSSARRFLLLWTLFPVVAAQGGSPGLPWEEGGSHQTWLMSEAPGEAWALHQPGQLDTPRPQQLTSPRNEQQRGEGWEWTGVKCLHNGSKIPRTLLVKWCHNIICIVDRNLQLLLVL